MRKETGDKKKSDDLWKGLVFSFSFYHNQCYRERTTLQNAQKEQS